MPCFFIENKGQLLKELGDLEAFSSFPLVIDILAPEDIDFSNHDIKPTPENIVAVMKRIATWFNSDLGINRDLIRDALGDVEYQQSQS